MGFTGLQSLDAGEAANVLIGGLGFDEVDFTEHLTDGATIPSAKWGVTNDMVNADGSALITITDDLETLQVSMTSGEILGGLQVLQPLANRVMTDNQNNWASHDLTTFSDAGSWLRTDADTEGMYWKLDPAYAPMVAGQTYKMKVCTNGQTWNGTGWEFKDYGGRRLESSTVPGTYFQVLSDPGESGQEFTFIAPAGTSGGFRVVALSDLCDVFYWDNFELVNTAADAVVVGLVFRVASTGDTSDDKLATAKGSAPAANDLFAVTGIGASAAVIYIGNAVGGYAWSANQTSTLTQTAANRASAGLNVKGRNLKEYALTYTIAVRQAIAPVGALAITVETFAGTSTALTITAGTHTTYFLSASDADAADFVIQSVATAATAGVLAISALGLRRCCDNDANAYDVAWWKIRAFKGAATFTAVPLFGDTPTSDEWDEHDELEGIFSRITGTAGVIHAYMTAYRE